MSEPQRAGGSAPWVTAGALAVVLIALAVTLFVVILPARHDKHSSAGALTSNEQHAVTAAATEAVNVLSFSRKNYAADFQRALDGATGAVKSDLQARKASTLSTITKSKIDLKASVAQFAYAGVDTKNNILVLVTVNGYNTNDAGTSSLPSPQRLQMTMNHVGSKWLVSDIVMVGIQ